MQNIRSTKAHEQFPAAGNKSSRFSTCSLGGDFLVYGDSRYAKLLLTDITGSDESDQGSNFSDPWEDIESEEEDKQQGIGKSTS